MPLSAVTFVSIFHSWLPLVNKWQPSLLTLGLLKPFSWLQNISVCKFFFIASSSVWICLCLKLLGIFIRCRSTSFFFFSNDVQSYANLQLTELRSFILIAEVPQEKLENGQIWVIRLWTRTQYAYWLWWHFHIATSSTLYMSKL